MRPLTFVACLAITCLTNIVACAEPPENFSVESPTHGTTFTLAEAKGQVVVLHFLLKTECPYCLRYTQSYAKESAKRKDVTHIFLKPDSAEEIKLWSAHLNLKDTQAPAIYRDPDAKLAKAFEIPDGYAFHGQQVHYPALVALDESGKELFRYVGKSNSDRLSYQDFERRLATSRSKSSDMIPHRLIQLVHAAEVQQELQLSDEQVKALEECFSRLDGPWFQSRIWPLDKQAAKQRELEDEFWSWARTSLKPEQLKRLKQLELQAIGSRMLLRDDVVKQLKFTSDQNDKLLALVHTTDAAQKKLQEAEQKRQSTKETQSSLNDAIQAEQRGVAELLTDVQKQQLVKLIGRTFDTANLKRIYPMAPELATETEWINSKPMTLKSLRGKVVLVHFYAFECHNCHANFEIYRRWHKKWQDQGVVVIGIQSPETKRERDIEAVRRAAEERHLDFPIIMDRDMKNWNAWSNTMWPTVYVIDKHGYLRHWWQGELNWEGATGDKVIEQIVESALSEK